MSFTKICLLRQTVKNVSWNLPRFVCRTNRDSNFVLCAGPTGTQNQNLRPIPDSFRYHKSNGSLRVNKRAFVENRIFRGNYYCLDLHEFYITWYGSVLKTEHTPNSCWRVEFNFELKSLFWLTNEKLTFWTILSLGSEIWNWSSEVRSCERITIMVGLI